MVVPGGSFGGRFEGAGGARARGPDRGLQRRFGAPVGKPPQTTSHHLFRYYA